MMNDIKRAVDLGGHAVLEGPTGMGKTIALLCGVLMSPQSKNRRVLYCCRTHRQMDRVMEELKVLNHKVGVSGISLRGRREMCMNPLVKEHTESAGDIARVCSVLKRANRCEFFKNLKRKKERVVEILKFFSNKPALAPELIELCREEDLCPYEVAKELLSDAQVVAASYIYLLDPSIRLHFLQSMDVDLNELIVVFDEAHNMPGIATEVASNSLSLTSISLAVKEAAELDNEPVYLAASRIHKLVETWSEDLKEEEERLVDPKKLLGELEDKLSEDWPTTDLQEILETLETIGEDQVLEKLSRGEAPRSYLLRLGSFLKAWDETKDKPYFIHLMVRTLGRRGGELMRLEIQALDPRIITSPVLSGIHSSVSMSGTLAPLNAYRDVVGLPPDTALIQYRSPFPPEHVLTLVTQGITTKETQRGKEMYGKIVERIAEVVSATPENVGVFTASYGVLNGLLEAGLEQKLGKPYFIERRDASSLENDHLVEKFKSWARKGGGVLLGVMGGRSAEGSDFPGEEMNAVVVVGIPYGRPTKRVEATIRYFESQFPGHGKFYGYYLPAHRRMSQAAGRAHRLLTDKAAVVLMDKRALTAFVRTSIPSWLRERTEVVPDRQGALSNKLRGFFQGSP
jgi:DNA excision repair protein ERCC-2